VQQQQQQQQLLFTGDNCWWLWDRVQLLEGIGGCGSCRAQLQQQLLVTVGRCKVQRQQQLLVLLVLWGKCRMQ
jgi:hypothetical protein